MTDLQFLNERFPTLAKSPEVKRVAKRSEQRTGKATKDPDIRIQNYLNRFKEIVEHKGPKGKNTGISYLYETRV